MLTLGRTGGGEVVAILPLTFFSIVILDDKTSAPEVFSSCSFIPRAHSQTGLVMATYYGYGYDVIST